MVAGLSPKENLAYLAIKKGVNAVRKTVAAASKLGIKAMTLFAFSSENWRRPEEEVGLLMELFITVLSSEVKKAT